MPTREEVNYFGAGPAPLPTPVIEAGAQAFVNFENSGLSLAEISHRSPTATKILTDTREALVSLLDIPDDYEVLFMSGGGSGEFSAVVLNLVAVWVERRRRAAEKELGNDQEAVLQRVRKELREELRLDYIVTGSWSLKASQEAANLLDPLGKEFVNIAVDSRENGKFGTIPPETCWKLSSNDKFESAFVYYCDNETVDGVEFPSFPAVLDSDNGEHSKIIVADMSSNFLSRRVDVSKYGVVFGGAQKVGRRLSTRRTSLKEFKNIGITDITLVIIRKDLLTTIPSPSFLHAVGMFSPPVILDWSIIAKNNSLYNTMPIFSIWIAGEVMRRSISIYGNRKLEGQEAVSNAKAEMIYRILDNHSNIYQPVNDRKFRSRMNICFRVRDSATEKKFLEGAEKRMLWGLKGHRSVGGVRASNYNAVSEGSVRKLVDYLEEFAQSKC